MKWVEKKSLEPLSDRWIIDFSPYRKAYFQMALLLILFAILYAHTFAALVQMWWNSDDYSHGFLVPFISFYLVWIKREQLSQTKIEPNLWGGIPIILLAGLMLVASKLGGFIILQEISLLVMIAGLVLLLAGKVLLMNLAMPIGYLTFMIKLFGEGSDQIHWPFQLLAANIGTWILQFFGFSVFQEANFIQLPDITLEVAAACSGIRFLMSTIAIGIPLAYLTQRTWARKIGLILFAVTISILANGLRVALIGIWTSYYGPEMIHGPFHIFYGVFVSWIGFVALFGGAWLFGRGSKKDNHAFSNHSSGSEKFQEKFPEGGWEKRVQIIQWNRSWCIAVLLLITMGSYANIHRISPLRLEKGFTAFPMSIGNWLGEEVDPTIENLKVQKADSEMARIYRGGAGQNVNLYIGYFDSQNEEKKLVTYTTSWKFHRGEVKVDVPVGSGQFYQVNQVVLKEGNDRRVVLFWYDLNGKVVASRYTAKLWSLWDALLFGRTNGALVALFVPLEEDSNIEQVLKNEKIFLRDLIPELREYLDSNLKGINGRKMS